MKKPTQRTTMLAIAIAALTTVAGAQAQTTSANNSTNAYAMTGVPKIYFDLSAGQTDYRLGNGSGLFGSNNGSTAYAISAGSYFTNNVGVELGYTDFGRINRGGGETRADGVTLKLVGRLPLGLSSICWVKSARRMGAPRSLPQRVQASPLGATTVSA